MATPFAQRGTPRSTLDKPLSKGGAGILGFKWHQPGTAARGFFPSIGISVCDSSSPPPIVSFMVFLLFFKRPCSLTFHHSYRGRHPRLFSYGNAYLLYIYIFFANLTKCRSPAGQREYLQRVQVPLDPAMWIRFVPIAVGSWLENRKKKKKKKDALTKDKVKKESSSSLAPFPSWSPLCPPSSLAVELQMPFQQSSASWRVLGIFSTCTLEYVVWVLQLAPQKAIQHPSIWLPAGEAPEMLQPLKDTCESSSPNGL